MKLTQAKLSYARNDLDPSLSEDTINYHYGKLYKTYVDRYNAKEGDSDFNEAGAFLHNIYFTQFQSPSNSNRPNGSISEFIDKHFKSFDNFKDQFEKEAMSIQGSGWVYLSKSGKIKTIKNHEIKNDIVLLIDWWEHAWALDYQADKKKYLENQWKIINWNIISAKVGLIQEAKTQSLMQELTEARILRSLDDIKTSYNDACENLYLTLLAVEFMAHCKETKASAKKYAAETVKWGIEYKEFRSSASDLYNMIYLVQAPSERVKVLFKSDDAAGLREKTHLPLMQLNGYLTSLTNTNNRDIYFIMKLESALGIKNTNSKEIRRLLSYHNPSDSDIKQTAYRIMNEFRNRLFNLDLMPDMERLLTKDLTFDR